MPSSKIVTIALPVTMQASPLAAVPYDVSTVTGDAQAIALNNLTNSTVTFTSSAVAYGFRWLVVGR